MSRAVDTYMAIKFLKNLALNFKKWDAYKFNLIDKDGKSIKKAKTSDEQSAMSPFMNLTRNFKRLLSKFPGNRNITSSIAVGLILLKEHYDNSNHDGDFIIETILHELLDSNQLNEDDFTKSNHSTIDIGRYIIESPYYNNELIYIKDSPTMLSNIESTPVYKVYDINNNHYFVTRDHLKSI